jgi:transcriptional regulator
MYAPRAFRIDEGQAAFNLIARFGFATLVTVADGGCAVSHLPMIGDAANGVLRGHLARANPHSSLFDGRRQLAVFVGANAYVSPDWYGDTAQVPTWNYSAVHVEGDSRIIAQPAAVDALLEELSDFHESRRHDLRDGKFWKLSKLPADKLARLRAGIVAFEISIDRLEYKAKLSQNKHAADFGAVMAKLAAGDESQRAVSAAMAAAGDGKS